MEMLCIYLLQHKIIHLSKTAVKAGYIILGNKPAILQELFCRRWIYAQIWIEFTG